MTSELWASIGAVAVGVAYLAAAAALVVAVLWLETWLLAIAAVTVVVYEVNKRLVERRLRRAAEAKS